MPNIIARSAYNKLLDDISRLYEDAKGAQVRFCWETGRRIVEVEQNGEIRAAYGAGLIVKLSADLIKRYGPGSGFSVSNLKRMRQYYLLDTKSPHAGFLAWSDHAELFPVKDGKVRLRLEKRIAAGKLSRDELRALVRKETGADRATVSLPPLKRPTDLKLHTYKKTGADIDCGFFIDYPAPKADLAGVSITETPSYTYAATVRRVVDGDTLHVTIEVGYGIKLREKLRLAGIDAPELKTPEGEKAKRFVMKLLPPGAQIVIRSSKDDKYGRFVADIFYLKPDSTPEAIISSGTYLNQELLDKGHALRMGE